MDIKYSLAWVCLIHLVLFACILLSKKTNRKANRALALFMLCLATTHFTHILIITHQVAPFHFLNELSFLLLFFAGPLYLQYVSSISDIKINWKKHLYLHLLPFIPVIIWIIGFYFKTEDEIVNYYEKALIKQPLDATLLTSIVTFQMGFYLIWSILLLNRYGNNLKKENDHVLLNLKWLQAITIAMLIVTFIIAPILIALAKDSADATFIYYPVLTMLIYGTIFYKSMNLPDSEIERKRIRENVRQKFNRDLHDDLGSGLSKISLLSNNLKEQLQHDKNSMLQVEKISQTTQDLANNMNQMVWSGNPENKSLESLITHIREYSSDFLENCGLQCHFQLPEGILSVELLPEQSRNLFLVVKESLNNIAKHASATQVWMHIFIVSNELHITIKDDGKGFVNNIQQKGNGLKNMQYRMESIGGKYKIESVVGEGAIITLSFPID